MRRTAIACMLAITLTGTSALAGSAKAPVISSKSVAEDAEGANSKDFMRLITLIAIGAMIMSGS